MRHYSARLRRDIDRYEFTVSTAGATHPVGYCIGQPDLESAELIEALGSKDAPAYIYYSNVINSNISSYHDDGHESVDLAAACYQKYMLDNRLNLNLALYSAELCSCGAVTSSAATVDGVLYALCNEHRNRQFIEKLITPMHEFWEA